MDFLIALVSWRNYCAILDFSCPFPKGDRVFWGSPQRLMGQKLSLPSARRIHENGMMFAIITISSNQSSVN
jgi:hypothetical protein